MGFINAKEILNDNEIILFRLPTYKITVCLKDYLPITFDNARITKQDNVNSTLIVIHLDGGTNYFNLNDVYRIICESVGE